MRASFAFADSLRLRHSEDVDSMPFLSVTATCASPVVTLVIRNGTSPSFSPWTVPFFWRCMSWRTTWSLHSSAPPSTSEVTTMPSPRTSNVRGSPSVSR